MRYINFYLKVIFYIILSSFLSFKDTLAKDCKVFFSSTINIENEEQRKFTQKLREDILFLRSDAKDLIGSGNNAFEGVAIQASYSSRRPLSDFISYAREFPQTEFEFSSLSHLIILSTGFQLNLHGHDRNELIKFFLENPIADKIPVSQRFVVLQTTLLTQTDINQVINFFKNFSNMPWGSKSIMRQLAAQASYISLLKSKEVIAAFREVERIKSPLILIESANSIQYVGLKHELSSTSRAFMTQLYFYNSLKK